MSQQPAYLTLTEANFDAEIRNTAQPVLVDFWAEWCAPCRAIAPIIEQLATEYHGRVKVGKVNIDENQGLAARLGVQSIPTLLIFRSGAVVDRAIGLVQKSVLEEKLNGLSRAA